MRKQSTFGRSLESVQNFLKARDNAKQAEVQKSEETKAPSVSSDKEVKDTGAGEGTLKRDLVTGQGAETGEALPGVSTKIPTESPEKKEVAQSAKVASDERIEDLVNRLAGNISKLATGEVSPVKDTTKHVELAEKHVEGVDKTKVKETPKVNDAEKHVEGVDKKAEAKKVEHKEEVKEDSKEVKVEGAAKGEKVHVAPVSEPAHVVPVKTAEETKEEEKKETPAVEAKEEAAEKKVEAEVKAEEKKEASLNSNLEKFANDHNVAYELAKCLIEAVKPADVAKTASMPKTAEEQFVENVNVMVEQKVAELKAAGQSDEQIAIYLHEAGKNDAAILNKQAADAEAQKVAALEKEALVAIENEVNAKVAELSAAGATHDQIVEFLKRAGEADGAALAAEAGQAPVDASQIPADIQEDPAMVAGAPEGAEGAPQDQEELQLLDQVLQALIQEGKITEEDAMQVVKEILGVDGGAEAGAEGAAPMGTQMSPEEEAALGQAVEGKAAMLKQAGWNDEQIQGHFYELGQKAAAEARKAILSEVSNRFLVHKVASLQAKGTPLMKIAAYVEEVAGTKIANDLLEAIAPQVAPEAAAVNPDEALLKELQSMPPEQLQALLAHFQGAGAEVAAPAVEAAPAAITKETVTEVEAPAKEEAGEKSEKSEGKEEAGEKSEDKD
jgi:hypothetical protein